MSTIAPARSRRRPCAGVAVIRLPDIESGKDLFPVSGHQAKSSGPQSRPTAGHDDKVVTQSFCSHDFFGRKLTWRYRLNQLLQFLLRQEAR
jgi:hypothetical protein